MTGGPEAGKLALHGGRPVREKLLPYGRQSLDESDVKSVVDVLRSDWITTGPKLGEFEEALAARAGARHAVAFSSGTAALHAAAAAAGNEAVTTPVTFCSTANSVVFQGGRPVFADVDPGTLNIDPAAAAEELSPRTKALIAVDYAGHPADMRALRALADRRGLVLIEDAAHSLGASLGETPVGALADMTVFSFHPVKHITTGEGGAVTTNDAALARKLRLFRSHGIDSDAKKRQEAGQWFYEMVSLGYNYRLDDIGAALGLSQLKRLEANLARRRAVAARYGQAFKDLPLLLPSVRPDARPAWHLYPVRLELEKLNAGRDEIFKALRAEGLGVNLHYIPVYRHPYYRDLFPNDPAAFPQTEAAYARLISLPMFHGMTDVDVEDVIMAVKKVLACYAA
jgi:perosamine synthetase